jgi:hypothetical protein
MKYTLDSQGSPRSVVIADVTDDGLQDVLVAKSSATTGFVEVWEQTGQAFGFRRLGVFTDLTMPRVEPYLRGFAVADFNEDGLPDVVVTDGELSCLFNDATAPGQFQAARRLLD